MGKSQLLHCDSDAETQVKIFVLCTEVTAENGPLVILGADNSRRLRARVTYRHNHRVTDEEAVAALGSLDDLHAITGRRCWALLHEYPLRVGRRGPHFSGPSAGATLRR